MELKELEEAFLNIEKKSTSELKELFKQLSELEGKVSTFRKKIHELTNNLRAELIKRLASSPSFQEDIFLENLSSTLETFPVSCQKSLDKINFSSLFTLPTLVNELNPASTEEIEKNLNLLRSKEAEVSYVRRLIHGWLDILKKELERRFTRPETTIELILQEINRILVNNF